MDAGKPKRILAVSSGGGHWVQLNRLAPSLVGHDVAVVTVDRSYQASQQLGARRFYAVNDATRWNKLGLILLALRIFMVLLLERPKVVITTGAAPGYMAIRLGKLVGARTIWIDSIANADQLSLSGSKAGKHADLWLTQWPHLATPGGPKYSGAVL